MNSNIERKETFIFTLFIAKTWMEKPMFTDQPCDNNIFFAKFLFW